jgi:hypothetical protein
LHSTISNNFENFKHQHLLGTHKAYNPQLKSKTILCIPCWEKEEKNNNKLGEINAYNRATKLHEESLQRYNDGLSP